jgi:hypothetical protein
MKALHFKKIVLDKLEEVEASLENTNLLKDERMELVELRESLNTLFMKYKFIKT